VYCGAGPIPTIPERIRDGLYPYSGFHGEMTPPQSAALYRLLPGKLRKLFHQTFEIGYADPALRPSAAEAARVLARCAASHGRIPGRLRRMFLLLLMLPRPSVLRAFVSGIAGSFSFGWAGLLVRATLKVALFLLIGAAMVGGGYWAVTEKPWTRWT